MCPSSASTRVPSCIALMRALTSFVSTSNSSRHSAASPRMSQLPRPSAVNAGCVIVNRLSVMPAVPRENSASTWPKLRSSKTKSPQAHADRRQLARIWIRALAETGRAGAEVQPLEVEHHRHFAREAEGHDDVPGDRIAGHRDVPRAVAGPQPAADVRELVADGLEAIDREVGAAEPLLDRPAARPIPLEVEQLGEARGLDAAGEPQARRSSARHRQPPRRRRRGRARPAPRPPAAPLQQCVHVAPERARDARTGAAIEARGQRERARGLGRLAERLRQRRGESAQVARQLHGAARGLLRHRRCARRRASRASRSCPRGRRSSACARSARAPHPAGCPQRSPACAGCRSRARWSRSTPASGRRARGR